MEIVTALGIGPAAEPTLMDLVKRGIAVFDTMHAGQEGLDYLKGADAVLASKPRLNGDNLFELVTTIPDKPQLVLIPRERVGRRRDDLGELARDDDRDADHKQEAVDKLRTSSRLLDRVREIISTEGDVKSAIKELESETGLDTKPHRQFLYQRQADFTTTVDDDELIEFRGEAVRPAVSASDALEVELHVAQSRADSLVVRTRVDSCVGEGLPGGFNSGGKHDIRITNPTWWQRVAIEGARGLDLPMGVKVIETISTCTLDRRPADVHRVHNWSHLLEATHAAIGEVLTAAREAAESSTITSASEAMRPDPLYEGEAKVA